MKPMQILLVLILTTVLVTITADRTTLAADSSPTGYVLKVWSQDGGGQVTSAPSGYALSGAVAQPDALTWSGGQYRLAGGFWTEAIRGRDQNIFLPLINR